MFCPRITRFCPGILLRKMLWTPCHKNLGNIRKITRLRGILVPSLPTKMKILSILAKIPIRTSVCDKEKTYNL